MPLLPLAVVVSKFTECLNGKERTPPLVALERTGVILNEKMTSAERTTLIELVEVTQRTEEFAQLRYLSGEEVAEVLSNTGGTMAATEAVQYIHVAQGVNLRR